MKVKPMEEQLLVEMIEEMKEDHDRGRSWWYCYNFFQENIKGKKEVKPELLDLACLNLAFYLASWGMYRGSTDLLQKDYKFFGPTVDFLWKSSTDDNYKLLWQVDDIINKKSEYPYKQLQETAHKLETKLKEEGLKQGQLNTLVTKIFLGTLACIPAFDTFVKNGLKYHNCQQSFNIDNPQRVIEEIIGFYIKNISYFESVENPIKISIDGSVIEIKFPIMKLIDMYFWKLGIICNDVENKVKERKKTRENRQ